jgi:ABC-type multidrug transport system ATPase subunit
MEGSTNKAFDPEGTQIEIEDLQLTESVTLTFQNVTKVLNIQSKTTHKFVNPFKRRSENYILRTLLDNVNGEVRPSEIVALMGPSGT